MCSIVEHALGELNLLAESLPAGSHVVTADIRRLSAKLYREVKDKSIDSILSLCEELLEEHNWSLGVIAYDWAYRVRKQYTEDTYATFLWLAEKVCAWVGKL